jgi:hypothetical protein
MCTNENLYPEMWTLVGVTSLLRYLCKCTIQCYGARAGSGSGSDDYGFELDAGTTWVNIWHKKCNSIIFFTFTV